LENDQLNLSLVKGSSQRYAQQERQQPLFKMLGAKSVEKMNSLNQLLVFNPFLVEEILKRTFGNVRIQSNCANFSNFFMTIP
jgi:hypothetical protein